MTTFAPVRTTAMYRAQLARRATFKDEHGWRVADVYTSPRQETDAARAAGALADVSARGKLGLRGAGLRDVFAKLAGGEPPAERGAARVHLNGTSALACRLAPDEVLVLTPAADVGPLATLLGTVADGVGCAHLTDRTSALAMMDLVGPHGLRVLARVAPLDLPAVPALGVVQGDVCGVHAVVVRLEHDLPAYRIAVSREYGEFVWRGLLEAGEDLDVVPLGAAAHGALIRQ